ncbi:MAG: nucleotidyltransferase domain-containing protein, partial [Sciscionella sp.]
MRLPVLLLFAYARASEITFGKTVFLCDLKKVHVNSRRVRENPAIWDGDVGNAYPVVRRMCGDGSCDSRHAMTMQPYRIAEALVAERFPTALAAFLGGSAGTVLATPTSDLDIVVLLDGDPAPFRQTSRYE